MNKTYNIIREAQSTVLVADTLPYSIIRESSLLVHESSQVLGKIVTASWEQRIASFCRKATSPEEHQQFWQEEARRLREEEGIPLDLIENVFNDFITERKPINPMTGQPHTPETAIKHWPSGVLPFMQEVLPNATPKRLFQDASPHDRGVNDTLRDLYNDDGSLDRLTAGVVALHSRANGNLTLHNKITRLETGRTLRKDMQNQFGRGNGVRPDGTFGPMVEYEMSEGMPTPKQYPRGAELRRRMMMPRQEQPMTQQQPPRQPYETTPQREQTPMRGFQQ
jgi:hypothetical protein